MPNAEKVEKVEALKARIGNSSALLLAEYRGLSVSEATELRRSLADQARFAVVKNTLMQHAATAAGIEDMEALLVGPTAIAFVDGDVVTAAKRVVDAGKKYPALILKGAYMDGRVLSAAEAQSLATLESREAMLSKIAGLMKAEMSRAANMFVALQTRFLGVLEAYKEKVPGPEPEPLVEAEPQATETEGVPAASVEAAPDAEEPLVADTDADTDEGRPNAESAEVPEATEHKAGINGTSKAELPEAQASADQSEQGGGANDGDEDDR